ncbi:MAG: flavodoxin, partial [Lachnospiraceae bacterium]|nr:flavodoxin [Lachnospiraceae bacterium]
ELSKYDTVFIGFPIWYGCAPIVVNTFCKAFDWSGKTVHAFATSGGSGIGKAQALCKKVTGGSSSCHSFCEVIRHDV